MRIRKPRPTLKDAHEFRARGTYSVGGNDYVTDAERFAEVERVHEELHTLATKAIPRTRNLEYMVLKCHTITEFAITHYIRCLSSPVLESKEIRFTYSQKLEIAYLLGFGVADPVLVPTLELLNKARNQVAHTLSFDPNVIREFLQINADSKLPKNLTLTEQLRGLRQITAAICGAVSGSISAHVHLSATHPSA
jgi:hypothetical protein